MKTLTLAALLGTLVACGRKDPPAPVVDPVPALSATAVPIEASAPAAAPTTTVAVFDGDKLVACLDLHSNLAAMVESMVKQADAGARTKGMTSEQLASDDLMGFARGLKSVLGGATTFRLKVKGDGQALKQPCANQFAGRAVISTCAVNADKRLGRDGGVGFDLHAQLRASFYAVTGDDRWMRGCLAAGGDWNEVAHDSAEYMRADHLRLYDELKAQ